MFSLKSSLARSTNHQGEETEEDEEKCMNSHSAKVREGRKWEED